MTIPDPSFLEDPQLADAVADTEQFVAAAGWDQPIQLFALIDTSELLVAEPQLAEQLDSSSRFTPVAQDPLPEGDLADALATVGWGPAVSGCVLVQEIVVLPPAAAQDPDWRDAVPEQQAGLAAAHPDRAEARLVAGVLRDGSSACLIRLRGPDEAEPLRGADLAPNLTQALLATFEGSDTGH